MTSPCPVIKMIGVRISASANSAWKSRPPIPGTLISRTRQLATSGRHLDLRKFMGRTEQFDSQVHRSEKTTESRAHCYIVVDDEDDSFRCACEIVFRFLGARSQRILLMQWQCELKTGTRPHIVGGRHPAPVSFDDRA